MKDKINSRVKFREEFRPFAPSILEEFGPEYFENYQDTPYMDRTLIFRPEVVDKVPAVVHSNRSGRLQSVKKDLNPKYHELISEFHTLTDIPILLNTSFNVMGKPIVHSFNDALMVFFNSGLDVLVVNDYIFEKGEG
jgi:carbamoyltransferase